VIPTYNFTPLMNVQFQFSYIYNVVHGSSFSGIHYLSPSFNHMSRTFGFTRIYYAFKITDNWQFDSRDSDQTKAGISHYFFFFNNKGRLNLAYNFSRDNTRGLSFERNSNNFKTALKTPLFYGIDLNANGNIAVRRYGARLSDDGLNPRRDISKFYSVGLSKVLTQGTGWLKTLTMYADYRYALNSTDLKVHEYKSKSGRVGLRALF